MRYATIHTKVWQDSKFRGLDSMGKMMFMYLLTAPHSNMIGYYYIPKLYMAADTDMPMDEIDRALDALVDAGMVLYDSDSNMLLLRQFLKYNPLNNENQVKGALQLLGELPESPLVVEFYSGIEAHCPDHTERFRDACKSHTSPSEAPRKPLSNPLKAPSDGLGIGYEEQVQVQVQDQVQQQEGVQGEPAAAYWDRMSVGRLNPLMIEQIEAYYSDGFCDAMIKLAMDKALLANAGLKYAFAVLDAWREKEVFTPEQAAKEEAEHRARGAPDGDTRTRYDPEAFRKMLEEAGIDA